MQPIRRAAARWRGAAIGVLCLVLGESLVPAASADPTLYEPTIDPAVGFNLISWSPATASDFTAALISMRAAGFTEVSISPLRFLDTSGDDSGTLITSGTPSLANIGTAISYAKNTLGMTVTVNPFIEPQGFAFWRGVYNPSGDEATRFWSSYEAYITEVAQTAQANGADFMTVGTELRALSQNSSFGSDWDAVIDAADANFSGQIGYASNWDEFNHPTTTASIWEHPAVDFLGVDGYFPVSTNTATDPTPQPAGLDAAIVPNWNNILDNPTTGLLPFAAALHGGDGLSVIFTEYGLQPWNRTVRQHGDVQVGVLDTSEQIQGFDGLLRALDQRRTEDNLLAVHVWHWDMVGANDNNWSMDATLPAVQPNNVPATQFLSDFVSGGIIPTDKIWTSASSGDFGAADNWTGGVPGAGDTATFNAAGTYTVTFDNSPNPLANPVQNEDLFIEAGDVTFRSGGDGTYTYRLTGAGGDDVVMTGGTLTLGVSGSPLHLTVDDLLVVQGGANFNASFGSHVNTTSLSVAQFVGGGNGSIVVDGDGTQLSVTNTTNLGQAGNTATVTFRNFASGALATAGTVGVANSSNAATVATLSVESGADLNVGSLNVGSGTAGTTATLHVQGAGTTLTQSAAATLTVGRTTAGGSATVHVGTIASGAELTTGTLATTINATGSVTVGSAGTSGTLHANGNVVVNGGALNVASQGTLNLASGRTLTVQNGGTATFDANYLAAANTHYAALGATSSLAFNADLELGTSGVASLTLGGGTSVDVGGRLTVGLDGQIAGEGTIDSPNDVASAATIDGAVAGTSPSQRITLTGYVGGTGTLDNVHFTGTHAPGASPAAIAVGNVSYAASATLQIEVGGTSAGSQYDQINSSETVAIDGILEILLIDDFVPGEGDSFDFLTATGTIDGEFDDLSAPAIGGGLYLDVIYDPTTVSLATLGALGDYNYNGIVDAADYTTWRDSLGQSGSGLAADGDGDTMITMLDYNVWKSHFGQTAGGGAGAASHLAPGDSPGAKYAVPEPAAVCLLVLGSIGSLVGHRRR